MGFRGPAGDVQPDLREPPAAPAGSDHARRALRGRRVRRDLQAARCRSPGRAARSISSRRRPTSHRSDGGVSEYRVGPDRWVRGQSRRTKSGGVVTSLVEISEVKRREREAMQARAVLQSVFDNMSDGVLLYEADGRWVYQNPAMAKLHDMSDQPSEHAADLRRHRPLSRPARRLRTGRQAARRPRRLDRKPGATLPSRRPAARAAAHHDRPHRRGHLSAARRRRVLTIHRDLTEIVEQEERLRAARIESEKTRETLQSVVDNMIDGVMLIDRDFQLRFINRQVNEFLQLSRRSRRRAPRPTTSCATRRGVAISARSTMRRARGQGRRAAGLMRQSGGVRYERRSQSRPLHRVQFPPDPRRQHAGDLSRHHPLKEQQAR